jgi:hypothetical protein
VERGVVGVVGMAWFERAKDPFVSLTLSERTELTMGTLHGPAGSAAQR